MPILLKHPVTGELQTINIKYHKEAHRALGWITTTDGKSTEKFKVLQKKATSLAIAIKESRTKHQDTTTACNSYCVQIIGYTLAANKLSLTQRESTQSPTVCVTLNKMGTNRNISRKIVFRPKQLGGLAMTHLKHNRCSRRIWDLSISSFVIGIFMCKSLMSQCQSRNR
jgi:hypothetical protein